MGQLIEGHWCYMMSYRFSIELVSPEQNHGKDVVPLRGPAKPCAIFAASSAFAEPHGLDPNSPCVSCGLSWVRSILKGMEWGGQSFQPP